jgi:hypothetical protein
MSTRFVNRWISTAVVGLCASTCALAQDATKPEQPRNGQAGRLSYGEGGAVTNNLTKEKDTPLPQGSAEPVKEVIHLLKSGVTKDVVKAYVEHSPLNYHLSAADLITLKEQAVPDEITTAMLKRSEQFRPAGEPNEKGLVRRSPPQPEAADQLSEPRGLDPESYDFWWYHYAYPRALASANQRMATAPYAFQPYYGAPYPFMPQPPTRWVPAP